MNIDNKIMPVNTRGVDYIIGDLHGEYILLMEALEGVSFNKEIDRLFSVGDIIDRGEDSLACLRLLHEPWFHSVLGNHEWFLLNHEENEEDWKKYGGKWFFLLSDEAKAECIALCEDLPYTLTVGGVGIVHALVPTNDWNDVKEMTDENRKECLWTPADFGYTFRNIENIDKVYLGHTVLKEVVSMGKLNFIDTGAYNYGNLTLCKL